MIFNVKDNIWFDNESLKIYRAQTVQQEQTSEKAENNMSVYAPEWRPTIIYLSATICNLSCKYCYADSGTYGVTQGGKQFTFENYVKTYTKMYELFDGISAISFFGGEPMVNFKEIKEFVEYLYYTYKKEEIPELSMNTNATIINTEILDFLKKYNFVIGTSIDGPKSVHDDNRISPNIPSTYDLVKENLGKVKDKNINVFAQYTFTKQHLELYEKGIAVEWYKEMESLPINSYDLIPVSSLDERYKIDIEDETTRIKYEQFCEETADYYLNKVLVDDISKVPRMFIGLMIRIMAKSIHKDCSAGYSFSITPNKKIYPCHSFVNHEEFAIDFDDIHSKEDFLKNEWFRKVREVNRLLVTKCDSCIAKRVCGAWCKGLVFTLKKDFNDVLEERCILMNIYTRKIIEFLIESYGNNREAIKNKLVKYNKLQVKLKHSNEN